MIFLGCVCGCWIQNKTEDCWGCQVTFQCVNKWLSTLKWLERVNKPGQQHRSHSLQRNVAIAHSLHIHHPIPSFLSMEIQNLFWIEYRVRSGVCHWNDCHFWSCVNYRNVRTDNLALPATFWSRLSTSRAEMFWLLTDALWCFSSSLARLCAHAALAGVVVRVEASSEKPPYSCGIWLCAHGAFKSMCSRSMQHAHIG